MERLDDAVQNSCTRRRNRDPHARKSKAFHREAIVLHSCSLPLETMEDTTNWGILNLLHRRYFNNVQKGNPNCHGAFLVLMRNEHVQISPTMTNGLKDNHFLFSYRNNSVRLRMPRILDFARLRQN